jgi:hypothetical protein
MHPSIVVCKSTAKYVAYPCSPGVVPCEDGVLPMVGFGATANEALEDLSSSIKRFVELYGSCKADFVLDSIYGKGNHINLAISNHPMMKYFTEII